MERKTKCQCAYLCYLVINDIFHFSIRNICSERLDFQPSYQSSVSSMPNSFDFETKTEAKKKVKNFQLKGALRFRSFQSLTLG